MSAAPEHRWIDDPARSIVRGLPLADEPGLGPLTLPGFLRAVTDRHADAEVLVEHRPDGSVLRWSYAELWTRSVAVAKALVACGLGKGERVGVLMTNRAEFLAGVFGAALAGGIATTISTFSTPNELDYLIQAGACSVLLAEPRVLKRDFAAMLHGAEPRLAAAQPGCIASARFPFLRHVALLDTGATAGAMEAWDDFLARGAAIPDAMIDARAAAVTPADPGVLFFSSGSTSKPKGILSAHRGVAIQMWRMARQQALPAGVRSWTANGFFWSGNFAMVLGATLAAGGSLVLQRTFDPVAALDLMAAERVSFLFAWPHQWKQLIDAPNWATTDLSALTEIDVNSPIAQHPTVSTAWVEPFHAYGNTETFTLSTGFPANTSPAVSGESHGRPFPGNTLKIVDPLTGAVVPVGTAGEVAIKGPTLMLGYLGVPLDETLDDEGFFRTGDGGHVDDGGRLFWAGRLNDIIKTGGANVSPVEIDDQLRSCPGVKMIQTVGVPDDMLGEIVVTCIVPQDGAMLDEAAVRAFARDRLASYKVPRRVLFFAEDALQLTGSAKIKTGDLRALVAPLLAGSS